MPSYFPCPNAQCQYQFDADILPPAAMVTCPLCRTKFPYRANAPVPTPSYPPTPGMEPPPMPVRTSERESAPSGPRVVNLREGPQRGTILTTILWSAGFSLVLIAILFTVYMWNRKKPFSNQPLAEDRWNFTIELPPGWEEDQQTRNEMNVNIFARKKTGQNSWVVMYAKDYGEREPRPAEVRDELLMRFQPAANIPDAPRAFRNLTKVETADAGQWMKQTALTFEFTADFNDIPVRGECHAVAYKGMTYGCYIFADEKEWDATKDEMRDFRNKIRLGTSREKWTPKQSNTRTHSPEGAPYQVEDRDDVWKAANEEGDAKQGDYVVKPQDIDKQATMAFLARHKFISGSDTRKRAAEAKALLVELPKGADPLETAKTHIIETAKKDYPEPPNLTFEEVKKSPSNLPLPTGGPAITRLILRNPLDRDDVIYWVIAAINIGDKTIAIEIQAQEKHAQYVESYMLNLAGSLRAK